MQRRIGDLRRQGLALLITSCGLLVGKGVLAAPAKPSHPQPSHPQTGHRHGALPAAKGAKGGFLSRMPAAQRARWQQILDAFRTQAARRHHSTKAVDRLLAAPTPGAAPKGHGGGPPRLAAAQAPACLVPVNPTLDAFGSTNGDPAEPSHRVTFGDFDGDGDLDLFLSGYYGYDENTQTSYSYLRYGENIGTTTNPVYVERTGAANPMNGVNVAEDGGNPGLVQLVTPAAGDLDGDGDTDLVVGLPDGKIRYFMNTGGGVLVEQTGPANPFDGIAVPFNAAPTLADIDGDGDMDVSIGSYLDGVFTFLHDNGSSPITFTDVTGNVTEDPFLNFTSGGGYAPYENSAPAFADIDGDGDLDGFVGANYAIKAPGAPVPFPIGILGVVRYFQNETGRPYAEHFGAERPGDSGNPLFGHFGFVPQPVLVDIDNDGDFDSFVGGGKGHIAFFENTGDATSPGFLDAGLGVTFVDIDGDGDLDAFAGRTYVYFEEPPYGYPENFLLFYENLGTASQPFWKLRPSPQSDKQAAKGATKSWRGKATAVPGKPTGRRSPVKATPAGNVPYNPLSAYGFAATFGDLDGDGDLDAMVGNKEGQILYFENTGSVGAPAFGIPLARPDATTSSFSGFTKPFLADMDADGDLDLVVGDGNGSLRYFENTDIVAPGDVVDGSGAFTERTGDPAVGGDEPDNPFFAIDVGDSASPWLVDWDGDGDLDLFVGDKYQVHLFPNAGSAAAPSFGAEDTAGNPLAPYGTMEPTPAIVDINADGLWDAFLGGFGSNEAFLGELPGVTVTPLNIITTEAGGQATFTVVLTSQPTSDVIIDVASNDTTEGVTDLTQLTFTPANWDQPQTVTVTGQPDAISDPATPYVIVLTMNGATVGCYATVDPADVNAVNLDAGGWPAQKAVSGSTQAGGTLTYTITLTNPTATTAVDSAGDEFSDVLPPQVTLVSATATSGVATANVGTNTVTWNGALAAGASVTITVTATINAGVSAGTVVSNQGTFSLDLDGNGTHEASFLTDDPATAPPSQPDPTLFTVTAAAVAIPNVPTLSQIGAALLGLLMAGLGVLGIRRR